MREKRRGMATIQFANPPQIYAWAAVGGKKESQGPLSHAFDMLFPDTMCGEKTWEQAEMHLQKCAIYTAANKCDMPVERLDLLMSGDLLGQCAASGYTARGCKVPYAGLYGACSTMAESLALASCMVDGGFVETVCACASSHFCTAERQYRFPLAYGGQRTPTAQWTTTGAGACILGPAKDGASVRVTHATLGKVQDYGITDANNMGAAMAPAAHDTIRTLLSDTGTHPEDYDGIYTGDLGEVGSRLLCELFERDGIDLTQVHQDCGTMLFDSHQDAHAGASGCGCSASVLCAVLLDELLEGKQKRIVFAGTGALMSPTTVQQGESVPGICHAVVLESGKGTN
ncbi:MAG: stage V sporulation protein AD [Eubacteriales bacterium]|nr:stage V sporulation protein AD [Eubacteriales bacterium]